MSKDLEKVFQIQEVLKETGYMDFQRISNEILSFHITTQTPLEDIFKDLRLNIPWEYICGYTEFCGMFFEVTRDTLIPRIETEQLVHIAKEIFDDSSTPFQSIIDVGTGSGCIAVALYKDIKGSTIIATDISQKVLDIAKKNAENNKITDIQFVKTDLISNIEIQEPTLILANLPYIPTKQYEELDPCVLNYEPKLALDGGKNGLELFEKLFKQVVEKRISKAKILVELEPTTLDEFINLVKKHFDNPTIQIFKDYRDLDRFVLISFS